METGRVRYPYDDDALGEDDTAELIVLLRSIMVGVDDLLRRYGEQQNLQRIEMLAIDLISRRDDDPITMGELADALGLSTPALTSRIDRLEEGGWVQRLRSEHDRRRVQLRITPYAHDATAHFFRVLVDQWRDQIAAHSAADRAAAHRILEGVFAGVLQAQADVSRLGFSVAPVSLPDAGHDGVDGANLDTRAAERAS